MSIELMWQCSDGKLFFNSNKEQAEKYEENLVKEPIDLTVLNHGFNIGDEVYYLSDRKIRVGKVIEIKEEKQYSNLFEEYVIYTVIVVKNSFNEYYNKEFTLDSNWNDKLSTKLQDFIEWDIEDEKTTSN